MKRDRKASQAKLTFDLAARVERLERSQQVILCLLADHSGKSVEETAQEYHKRYEQLRSA